MPLSSWVIDSSLSGSVDYTGEDLPRAHGPPLGVGRIRSIPEDFQVNETITFEPTGSGEHALLEVEKRNLNTADVATTLARFAAVPPRDVGFAGLKDRRAVTSQWFSVRLAGKADPDWFALDGDSIRIRRVTRHDRKLRRGAVRANRFHIRVRELSAAAEEIDRRLQQLRQFGFPNYFGEQRFGRNASNLEAARRMFQTGKRPRNRQSHGFALSAARALLFNQVLAHRVETGTWNRAIPGDAMMLDGTRSFFVQEEPDEQLAERIAGFDIHPTGPLWGKGDAPVTLDAARLEQSVLAPCESWRHGLEQFGLAQDRRALRVPLRDLDWEYDPGGGDLVLGFSLPAGAYATAMLREIASVV